MSIEIISKLARDMPELKDFHHFQVDPAVWKFAVELCLDQFPEDEDKAIGWEKLRCPSSARLPASRITIITALAVFALEEQQGDIVCLSYHYQHGQWGVLGGIRPGHSPKVKEVHDPTIGPDRCFDLLLVLGWVLSLINEPRVLSRQSCGTRQQRRAAHRGMGFDVDAWTRVTWDLSKETIAKVSRDPSFHKVPLHWRRGHFRRAMPHYEGAIQRPDAIRVEDRLLWWQWIDGQWVGHPAFGIKRSVHAPRISGADIARRRAA